ncbi:6-phosphogluconolactonase [Candidatus Omnitrophota bacterium]
MDKKKILFESIDDMSRYAADSIMDYAQSCIHDHGYFSLVLSGGSTPRRLYELLSESPYREAMPWKNTHVFWGDERCVPPDDPHSNYAMAFQALLSKIPIQETNIFRMTGETRPEEQAAIDYERSIRDFDKSKGVRNMEFPSFDLILLGVGNDGHTASLFPGNEVLQEQKRWVSTVTAPPDMPVRKRLTLTVPVINNASGILFLVSGAGKHDIVEAVFYSPTAGTQYPAAQIAAKNDTLWLITKE